MSTKTSAIEVEKVEVDLSEKGLTELAKMLVQSGRISAPSFTNWCSRVSSNGSRWARDAQSGSSKTGKPGKKPEKKVASSKATVAKDGNSSGATSKKTVKDGFKLSGLMKARAPLDTTSWDSVLSSSDEDKTRWYQWTKAFLSMAEDKAAATRELFKNLDLTEEEIKGSRAWFPILPGKAEKELYDSIDISSVLQNDKDDAEPSIGSEAESPPKKDSEAECPPKKTDVSLSKTKEAPTSSVAAVGPDVKNVWKGNSPAAAVINSNAGRTGTLLMQELAYQPTPQKEKKKKGGKTTIYSSNPNRRGGNKSGRGYY